MFKLGDLFAQNLRDSIPAIKEKLERLTDAYLAEALELAEYQERKNTLMAEKKTIEEKLSDFERKGNHWLEPPTFGGNSFGGIQTPWNFLAETNAERRSLEATSSANLKWWRWRESNPRPKMFN